MNGSVMAVIYRTEDGRNLQIVIDDDDIYEEGDGTTMITLDWKKIALNHATYIQHLRDERRQAEAQATPPEYIENE